ncbi:hypothetical protein CXG81DRAFT_17911 [Caulochytrium protostelioides]|uniref:Uncharacterized protein n=1 Tax=Caulochytrium protostelioides TaxID=1555241 RepID=A0A4P9WYC2_9FUNG|nr:hypothetical protein CAUPRSCDRAFT_10624 [Caulochytrium protostelioides]RKP02384.1 hypothetical protein CXG81DRAFT_17911 [Caulochytrium protostelioides]|eukprot:RKP02384.1 hypothetical protein CXG81DRAFT_17911 [Caulochytrium protostelioides]
MSDYPATGDDLKKQAELKRIDKLEPVLPPHVHSNPQSLPLPLQHLYRHQRHHDRLYQAAALGAATARRLTATETTMTRAFLEQWHWKQISQFVDRLNTLKTPVVTADEDSTASSDETDSIPDSDQIAARATSKTRTQVVADSETFGDSPELLTSTSPRLMRRATSVLSMLEPEAIRHSRQEVYQAVMAATRDDAKQVSMSFKGALLLGRILRQTVHVGTKASWQQSKLLVKQVFTRSPKKSTVLTAEETKTLKLLHVLQSVKDEVDREQVQPDEQLLERWSDVIEAQRLAMIPQAPPPPPPPPPPPLPPMNLPGTAMRGGSNVAMVRPTSHHVACPSASEHAGPHRGIQLPDVTVGGLSPSREPRDKLAPAGLAAGQFPEGLQQEISKRFGQLRPTRVPKSPGGTPQRVASSSDRLSPARNGPELEQAIWEGVRRKFMQVKALASCEEDEPTSDVSEWVDPRDAAPVMDPPVTLREAPGPRVSLRPLSQGKPVAKSDLHRRRPTPTMPIPAPFRPSRLDRQTALPATVADASAGTTAVATAAPAPAELNSIPRRASPSTAGETTRAPGRSNHMAWTEAAQRLRRETVVQPKPRRSISVDLLSSSALAPRTKDPMGRSTSASGTRAVALASGESSATPLAIQTVPGSVVTVPLPLDYAQLHTAPAAEARRHNVS